MPPTTTDSQLYSLVTATQACQKFAHNPRPLSQPRVPAPLHSSTFPGPQTIFPAERFCNHTTCNFKREKNRSY